MKKDNLKGIRTMEKKKLLTKNSSDCNPLICTLLIEYF